jgi:O-antigen/teichoic acid export membrane protein
MVLEKVIKMATHLAMIVLLAKYLGPESLGSLMYCFAIASIFMFLNQLGLDSVLVKHFVMQENNKFQLLRNAFVVRFVAALCCVVLINSLGLWLVDDQTRLLLLVISIYHIFLPATVLEWYFQSQGRGDLSGLGQIAGHVAGFIFRLICLYFGTDLIWFGIAYIVESACMFMVYTLLAHKQKIKVVGTVSISQIKTLLKESAPIILSGAIVLLYMKVDQIMLGKMVGNAEVGIYVAASRLSEAWYFIGLIIISAYFPQFIAIKQNESEQEYHQAIVKVGRWLVWGGILLAVITTFISPWLISLLYGQEYTSSANVLMISIWAVPFVYLGGISTKMYVALSQSKNILWRSVSGLLMNLILNYFLIPLYGAVGAAMATLVSQIMACYLFNLTLLRKNSVFLIQSSCFFRVKPI